MVVDSAGNPVITGQSVGIKYDYYTARYAAANGALLWEKSYNGPANSVDSATSVAIDSAGNVAITGTSYFTINNYDYYTAKYAAANGALIWERHYDGPAHGNDSPVRVAVDRAGNVVVTGESVGSGSGYDYHTAK